MGLPLESGLAVCCVATALAEEAGLADEDRNRVHQLALIRHIGCTAENAGFGEIVGDDVAFRGSVATRDVSAPRVLAGAMIGHLYRKHGLVGTAAKLAWMAGQRDRFQEGVLAVCEVGELLAAHLGLGEEIQNDLLLINERWDGKSFLKRAREEGVPLAVRVVQVAECAAVYNGVAGPEAAIGVVRERAGSAFDPRLAGLVAPHMLTTDGSLWDAVVALGPKRLHDELDAALAVVAEFADLRRTRSVIRRAWRRSPQPPPSRPGSTRSSCAGARSCTTSGALPSRRRSGRSPVR